jgi:hypothetical protein
MFTKMKTILSEQYKDIYSIFFDDSLGASIEEIDTDNSFTIGTDDFSFSFWINMPNAGGQYIFGKTEDASDRWYLKTQSNDDLKFFSKIGGSAKINATSSNNILSDDTWAHIIVTANRDGNMVFYKDGAAFGSAADISGSETDNFDVVGDFNIGHAYVSADVEGSFYMSDFAIYEKIALSADQVTAIYNEGKPYNHKKGVAADNLKLWYRMGDGLEQGQEFTIYDMSGNNNHGTMVNMEIGDITLENPH